MDTSKQLYEQEATGWKRGTYEDIKQTFRAPFVNWVFRTTMANYPEFLRYAWGQVKPVFQTRSFAQFSVDYRDALLSAVEDEFDLPTYRRAELDVRPAEYREFRGQIATFDIVAPRLALLFELVDRSLHGKPVETNPDKRRAATEPFQEWLDRDRGLSVTMLSADQIPEELDKVIREIKDQHGLKQQLPSIYRCLAQWPGFLTPAWNDLKPILRSDAFEQAGNTAGHLVDDFVTTISYHPRLSSDALRGIGMDNEVIDGVQQLFQSFSQGPARNVIRTLPLFAFLVDATGQRTLTLD